MASTCPDLTAEMAPLDAPTPMKDTSLAFSPALAST